MNHHEIQKALCDTINRTSLDALTNTPDHILADYLMRCALTFASVAQQRDEWRGIPQWQPGQTVNVQEPFSDLKPTPAA